MKLKDVLDEGRPWGREIGAEWDEDDRIDAMIRAKNKRRDAQKAPEKTEPKPQQEPEKKPEQSVDEVAPPGFEKAVKAMKKDKSVDNPYAVAWSMKKKGDKPSDDVDEGAGDTIKRVAKAGLKNAAGELSDQIGNAQKLAHGALSGGAVGMAKAAKDMKAVGSRTTRNLSKWSDGMDEMDASQPYAPSSAVCEECGMREGHAEGCPMVDEAREPSSYDHDGTEMSLGSKRAMAAGRGRADARRSAYDDHPVEPCPECGGPPGRHDAGCPLAADDRGGLTRAERLGESLGDDDDDDFGHDEEACPGCGAKPGDGINPKCDDPMGCGYWREFKRDAEGSKGRSLRDMLGSVSEPDDDSIRRSYGEREGFETKHGEWIENPFWDESGREEVDPDAHYGDAFRKSALAKRLRWGENSDYDGLPLNESSMFDRFDTLVGHRFDGTFDARDAGSDGLRSLVRRVVREAWSTYDPKTGEETEHSVDDD